MAWGDWVRTVEIEPSVYAADFAHLGEQVQYLLNAGALTFHVEVADDLPGVIAQAREHGLEVGVAFNPGTEVETAAAAANQGADLCLCMSIVPGYSGQELLEDA